MTAPLPDLEDLEILVLVARSGSIGQAAVELDLSQPSVSRRMSALERRLGLTLLDRSRRGSTLTPQGRVVVDWAATLLAAADDFGRSVVALREGGRDGVRAAVSMTIAEHYAPGWVARLADTRISLLVHNSTDVVALVGSGAADVGFVESPTVPRDLRRRRVGTDVLVVAVPPGHAWARRRRVVTVAELAATPLLVREEGSGTRETLERGLARHRLSPTVALAMASNTALKAAALSGIAPVVLSGLALQAELDSGRLARVNVAELDLRRPLTAVWRRDRPVSSATAALLSVAGSASVRDPLE